MDSLKQLAVEMVERAMKRGASAAECMVREGREFSTTVRLDQVESLKEAGSKGLGLRVLVGQRSSGAYTSDFSAEALERVVSNTLAMARLTSEDPHAGLPEPELLGQNLGDLGLYCDDVQALSTAQRIAIARRAEKAALAADPRIKNSEGASLEAGDGRKILANSLGFVGEYWSSFV